MKESSFDTPARRPGKLVPHESKENSRGLPAFAQYCVTDITVASGLSFVNLKHFGAPLRESMLELHASLAVYNSALIRALTESAASEGSTLLDDSALIHSKAALTLLSGYPTPDGLRHIGTSRLTAWLKKRSCRNSAAVAQKAVDATNSQNTVLATQTMKSTLTTKLAAEITVINHELVELDT